METDLLQTIHETLEELKAIDTVTLDVRDKTTVTDYMIITTGNSNRHTRAVAENIIENSKKKGHRPIGVEGLDVGEWVLVDLGDVVVHVFLGPVRAFYTLEDLWGDKERSRRRVRAYSCNARTR